MGLRTHPTQRQRRLAEELRRLRESTGMSATEAGSHADLGRAHMSHIETGRTGISEDKLRRLLNAYGVASKPLVNELVEMAQPTGPGWWSRYTDAVDSRACDLAELESTARAHRSFQWVYVPGLLQTPAYMRALFESGEPDTSTARRERYAEFRQRRQRVLHGPRPPRFHAVVHEAAFHMHFVPRDVMLGQLDHLLEMGRLPHVEIQLLPFRAPSYPATSTAPFVIFDASCPELRTVYVEHPVSASFLSERAHIAQFTTGFEQLSNVALSPLDPTNDGPRSSLRLLQHLRYLLEEAPYAGP
ncbi:helix-turn-helix domain-containing protein [Streptomyces sp. NPDC127098]|uniref:helix-turn-helix domain-containing protein n=1 Tax=Streptomyces sp. NPDC127098 TaxID=3347137 RepID=UPI00365917F8